MSGTLTIALASLGGVVLAGLVAHGAWQARQAGPKRAVDREPAEPREPVMDAAVIDEAADPDAIATPPGSAASASSADARPATVPERRPNRRAAPRLDALIDAIATLALEAPISGAFALSHLPPTRR